MERTKKAIVDAFQQELEEMPINKITVKSIVERCGINRNTFYYYFDGIPGLVEYHLITMADQLIDSFDQPDVAEELRRTIQYFTQRKRSVLHTYLYLPREEFLRFLDKIAAYLVEKHIRRIAVDPPLSQEDLNILVLYYKGALVGALLDWLDAGMNYDMETMVIRLCKLMQGSARHAIQKAQETEQ